MNRTWYRIENQADDSADIYLFDFIGDWIDHYWGFGVSTKQFLDQLAALPESVKTIRLHVNSPGGDPFAAQAIASMLRDQQMQKGRTVEVSIEGLAASAATIVTSAGNPVRIGDNALMMVHNPFTFAIGEAKDMRKVADNLDVIRGAIIRAYQWKSPLSEAELGELMDAITWMDADDALLYGFADEKVEGVRAVATAFDARGMVGPGTIAAQIPEKYRDRVQALVAPLPDADLGEETSPEPVTEGVKPEEEPEDAADASAVLAEVEAAGFGASLARELIETKASLSQVKERIGAEVTAKTAAEARAKDIRAVCALAKCPELAEGYIRGGMSLAEVQTHLTTITAKHQAEIDSTLLPDAGNQFGTSRLDVKAIYAERNRLGKPKEG